MGQKYEAIQQRLEHQRVFHIIDSYSLDGDDAFAFRAELDQLLLKYPAAQVELAIVETLVQNWASTPLPRGSAFLEQVMQQLTLWNVARGMTCCFTPLEFEQITGLTVHPWTSGI